MRALVQVELGAIATHASRHVLTGAITTEKGELPAELCHVHLSDGDQLLLCSDGLAEMATDGRIAGALSRAGPAEAVCRALIDLALEGGNSYERVKAMKSFPAAARSSRK